MSPCCDGLAIHLFCILLPFVQSSILKRCMVWEALSCHNNKLLLDSFDFFLFVVVWWFKPLNGWLNQHFTFPHKFTKNNTAHTHIPLYQSHSMWCAWHWYLHWWARRTSGRLLCTRWAFRRSCASGCRISPNIHTDTVVSFWQSSTHHHAELSGLNTHHM